MAHVANSIVQMWVIGVSGIQRQDTQIISLIIIIRVPGFLFLAEDTSWDFGYHETYDNRFRWVKCAEYAK